MDTEDRLARLALEKARATRHCPPAELLFQPDDMIRRHMEGCEHCRELYREMLNGMVDERKGSGAPMAKVQCEAGGSEQEPASPGQVRLLRKDLFESTFDGEHWNNAPLVLILLETSIKGVFRAAQICDCAELAGPGDVFLSEGGDAFAESWNTWPVLEGDLGPVLSAVEPSVVERVCELESKSAPSAGTPLRREFRDMELGIGHRYGSYFAGRAVELYEYYASSWSDILSSPESRAAGKGLPASTEAVRKIRSVISYIKSESHSVPAPEFLLAADTRPVQLTSQHRAVLEYSFGRSRHGYVNVFEFSSFSEEMPGYKKIDAEFFTAGGTLHAVFDWGAPGEKGRLRAAVLLGGEEMWLETGLEFGRRTITLETEAADISSLLFKMKILVFDV